MREILRYISPVITENGRLRLSREATLSLIKTLIGLGVFFGLYAPESIADAGALAQELYDAAEQLVGLLVIVWGMQTSAKRHREAHNGQ